jgi:hypothetical protein
VEFRIGDRDPVSGLYDVIYPDGSVTRNGLKIFNSVHQFGDVVLATQRSDGMLILDGVKTEMLTPKADFYDTFTSSEGGVGYLNGQVFNEEDELTKTHLSVEFAVFGSQFIVSETSESMGFYNVFLDSRAFVLYLTPPPIGGDNLIQYPQFQNYDVFDVGTVTSTSFQAYPYELTFFGYAAIYNNSIDANWAFPPVFEDVLYADFQQGQRPTWFTPGSQLNGAYIKVNEWVKFTKVVTAVSPIPAVFGNVIFYVEGSNGGFWSNSPTFPGRVFPISSEGVHELQLDVSQIIGDEITIHCIPLSPPVSGAFGVRTGTIKRRSPFTYVASPPVALDWSSSMLLDEVVPGAPDDAQTAFVIVYQKSTNQFA